MDIYPRADGAARGRVVRGRVVRGRVVGVSAVQGIASIGRRWNAWPGPSVPDELGVGVRIPRGAPPYARARWGDRIRAKLRLALPCWAHIPTASRLLAALIAGKWNVAPQVHRVA